MRSDEMLNLIEEAEDRYVLEAGKPAGRRWLRWGAVAACFVLVVALFAGFLGHLPARQKEIVLPPTRFGTEASSVVSLARHYTFEEAATEAEVIAWVRIENWLGERNEPMDCSFFDAEVVRCYKGSIPENFVLRQLGSSSVTLRDYPLFTNGNELLLFLKKSDLELDNEQYENCYKIMGTFSTVMDISRSESGEIYVSDRHGMLGESIEASAPAAMNVADNVALMEKIGTCVTGIDTIQGNIVSRSQYVYSLDAIEDLLG